MSVTPLSSLAVGRLPDPGDNVAIAVRRLEAGTPLDFEGTVRPLAHTVLEGHRFAVRAIAPGEPLISWGFPFGVAVTAISEGDYVCNDSILKALAVRQVGGVLPEKPNFADRIEPFLLDERAFRPGAPTERAGAPRTFQGYRRPGGRGVGTRNFIVVIGTTSLTASYARRLVDRLQPLARVHPGLDGIVAIAHTEGAGPGEPNNAIEVLRALAGFIVHPNVAAVLVVDYGNEPINNARLRDFMRAKGYPLDSVPHHFVTIRGGVSASLADDERIIRSWLPAASAARRTEQPLSELRVALQCGGSDAFSGVSGNPLAGAMAHEVVRNGGSANLCETDEIVGAEAYLLQNVKDLAVARVLLAKVEGFKARLAWHGTSAESNPSGGNKLRGLYNIVLKSLGAAHKKDPRTRIDAVIDYAEPMGGPGFYFMNSPGNDLEGIAGQVGAGCNLFLFVTGNGSITNFPFVPTLKITTTTRRHQLLIHEMDINAGRYLDGEPMAALAADAFDLLVATASGQRTKGEHAGHSQVSLWRNWRQTDGSHLAELSARAAPDGRPLADARSVGGGSRPGGPGGSLPLFRGTEGFATERIGLVLPTSMCSAQIARLAAERLNKGGLGHQWGISRFVGLTHTEGCGFGGESMHRLLNRTYRAYATHPNVAAALLLEHGCEKVPNDVMRREFEKAGVPLDRFGWASVQLDGGIDLALAKIEAWFAAKLAALPPEKDEPGDLGSLCVGLMSSDPVTVSTAETFVDAARTIVGAGGSVLLPEGDPLVAQPAFAEALLHGKAPHATLAYGEPPRQPGLHLVATETDHWVENLTGLGGCGVHLFLTVVSGHARQGHPMLPVLQVAEDGQRGIVPAEDIDAFLSGDPATDLAAVLRLVSAVAGRKRIPAASAQGLVDFQLTRGQLGVST